jgi:hypothetical protein
MSSVTVMPSGADAVQRFWYWLKKLGDAAIAALREDWSIDQLEVELYRLGSPAAKLLRATSMQDAFLKLWTVNLVQT